MASIVARAADSGRSVNAAVSLLQRLHGRTPPELIREIQTAAQRVSIATRSWSTVEPKPAAVDEVLATVHGLSRALSNFQSQAKLTRVAYPE